MREHGNYSRPPITDAIIDFRTRCPESLRLNDLEKLRETIGDQFSDQIVRHHARRRFDSAEPTPASSDPQPNALLFQSGDGRRIFQARLDGCSASRPSHYEGWESLKEEACRLWRVYREVARPYEVVQLGARYVNRIDIPTPIDDLSRYLRTYPELSPELSQNLSGLFMQLLMPQPDIHCSVLLSEVSIKPAKPGSVSIILDIDLFRESQVPQDETGIRDLLEVLRHRKNEIFEACITDKTRELFD